MISAATFDELRARTRPGIDELSGLAQAELALALLQQALRRRPVSAADRMRVGKALARAAYEIDPLCYWTKDI